MDHTIITGELFSILSINTGWYNNNNNK